MAQSGSSDNHTVSHPADLERMNRKLANKSGSAEDTSERVKKVQDISGGQEASKPSFSDAIADGEAITSPVGQDAQPYFDAEVPATDDDRQLSPGLRDDEVIEEEAHGEDEDRKTGVGSML